MEKVVFMQTPKGGRGVTSEDVFLQGGRRGFQAEGTANRSTGQTVTPNSPHTGQIPGANSPLPIFVIKFY